MVENSKMQDRGRWLLTKRGRPASNTPKKLVGKDTLVVNFA